MRVSIVRIPFHIFEEVSRGRGPFTLGAGLRMRMRGNVYVFVCRGLLVVVLGIRGLC